MYLITNFNVSCSHLCCSMVSLETNLPFVIFYSYILVRYLCIIPIYQLLILSPTHSLDLSLVIEYQWLTLQWSQFWYHKIIKYLSSGKCIGWDGLLLALIWLIYILRCMKDFKCNMQLCLLCGKKFWNLNELKKCLFLWGKGLWKGKGDGTAAHRKPKRSLRHDTCWLQSSPCRYAKPYYPGTPNHISHTAFFRAFSTGSQKFCLSFPISCLLQQGN